MTRGWRSTTLMALGWSSAGDHTHGFGDSVGLTSCWTGGTTVGIVAVMEAARAIQRACATPS
jgi:hypothetical protein